MKFAQADGSFEAVCFFLLCLSAPVPPPVSEAAVPVPLHCLFGVGLELALRLPAQTCEEQDSDFCNH